MYWEHVAVAVNFSICPHAHKSCCRSCLWVWDEHAFWCAWVPCAQACHQPYFGWTVPQKTWWRFQTSWSWVFSGSNKLVMVVLVERYMKPLECKHVQCFTMLPAGKALTVCNVSLNCRMCIERRGPQILSKRIITSRLHAYILLVTRFLISKYLAYVVSLLDMYRTKVLM